MGKKALLSDRNIKSKRLRLCVHAVQLIFHMVLVDFKRIRFMEGFNCFRIPVCLVVSSAAVWFLSSMGDAFMKSKTKLRTAIIKKKKNPPVFKVKF